MHDPHVHLLNVGDLIRSHGELHTREAVALVHELCAGPFALPTSADGVLVDATGAVRVDPASSGIPKPDVRIAAADLLESLLPASDTGDRQREVQPALRGLPSRLRATAAASEPSREDRKTLMAILAWHLGGEGRAVIRDLVNRVSVEPAVASTDPFGFDELEPVEPAASTPPPPSTAVLPATSRQIRLKPATMVAAVAMAVVVMAVGYGAYWLVRDGTPDAAVEQAQPVASSDRGRELIERDATDAPPAVPAADSVAGAAASSTTPAGSSLGSTEVPNRVVRAPASQDRVSQRPNDDSPRAPQPLRIEARDGAFSPTFASSGRELFFHTGRSGSVRLGVADLDGGEVSRVTHLGSGGARDYHVRVSPDGRAIAFDSDRDGERGVYVAERDGSNARRVSGEGYAAVPSWSPDMRWLAFVRGEPNRPRVWNLWLRDQRSGELRRHTSFRSGQVWAASWFPGGRTLCYSHEDRLVITTLDGGETMVFRSPVRGRLMRTPAVSPDGRRIVFQVFRDGVWLLDVDSRSMRRILSDPSAEEFAWAPDGRRIAYHSRRDGSWKIWVMDAPA